MVSTGIIVNSTWFCQGQGYRFCGYKDVFVVFHSMEIGSCLVSSSCLMNETGSPGLAWEERSRELR